MPGLYPSINSTQDVPEFVAFPYLFFGQGEPEKVCTQITFFSAAGLTYTV